MTDGEYVVILHDGKRLTMTRGIRDLRSAARSVNEPSRWGIRPLLALLIRNCARRIGKRTDAGCPGMLAGESLELSR